MKATNWLNHDNLIFKHHNHTNTQGYPTVEMALDDVSTRITSSCPSRFSRPTSGPAPVGSMRICKPNSASNSPRGSMGLGRRRTVMNDGTYRRRRAVIDQNKLASTGANGFVPIDGSHACRSSRPVSWHPASMAAPPALPTYYQLAYNVPATPDIHYHQQNQLVDFSPSSALCSGYSSPTSARSPVYSSHDQNPCIYPDHEYLLYLDSMCQGDEYEANALLSIEQQHSNYTSQLLTTVDSSVYSHFDWNHFSMHDGPENSVTSPPTPHDFLPAQHADPTWTSDDAIPYQPLSEEDSAGEELIGMGLYDHPEPAKVPSADPQLDNYRVLMSQLWGGGSLRRSPEPHGKGLKLEETWNPPPSDDGDDEDDEQDGEGDEKEDDTTATEDHQTLVNGGPLHGMPLTSTPGSCTVQSAGCEMDYL